MGAAVTVLIVFWLFCGVVGAAVASSKGRKGEGFWLGVLLGPIGVVIAAVLSPTEAVRAQRNQELAWAIARAKDASGSIHAAQEDAKQAGLREAAIAEALRRDPELGANADLGTLERLATRVAAIEGEMRLRQEVAALQAKEAAAQNSQRQLEVDARRDEQRRQSAKREQARQAEYERLARQQREDRLAAMSPLRRWVVTHRALACVVAIGVILGVIIVPRVWLAMQEHSAQMAAQLAEQSAAESARQAKAKSDVAAESRERRRCSVRGDGVDLTGCRLFGEDFSRASLVGAQLRRAILSNADFTEANLAEADLSSADLAGADMRGANLSGANLSGANLSGAILAGADLSEADLTGARLWRVDLSGLDLAGANLSQADLTRANLARANLIGADLRNANLSDVYFRNADLSGADLRGAQVIPQRIFEATEKYDARTRWPRGVSPPQQ